MTRRRVLLFVAVITTLIVSATAVWLALPRLARWAVVWQVEAQTGRKLTMREFDFDLRSGRLRIAGLRLDARVRILRTGRGLLNISDLLRPSKPRKQAAAFTLDRLALTRGAIMFEDRTLTPPRAWRADALTIEAAQLSTVNPEPRGRGRLTTTVAGAPLSVEVSEVRLAPMHGRVRVSLRDMDATLANLYLPPNTASNATFLTTLRYLLIQDWDLDDDGRPETLRLCDAIPPRWLKDGAVIFVDKAPSAFGEVSLRAESRLKDGESIRLFFRV